MTAFTAALIQTTSGDDMDANIAAIEPMLLEAVSHGASLICLPENAFYMRREGQMAGTLYAMETHPGVLFCQRFAKANRCHIIIGSIRASVEGSEKAFNREVVIDKTGRIIAHYDKIHLFDVTLPNGHEYRESSQFLAGDTAVTVALDGCGTQGLSICYDLRFPHLYRHLSDQGAEVLHVPAAFTRPTGEVHWHVLLRARAIENGAYVLAAAQCGEHPGGRTTYGHALVVDPWGEIIAEGGETPQVVLAKIDLNKVKNVRAQLPVLQHYRPIN